MLVKRQKKKSGLNDTAQAKVTGLAALRKTATDKLDEYNKAVKALDAFNTTDIGGLKKTEKDAKDKYEKTYRDCKIAQYDLYHASLQKREKARADDLAKIKKLLA